MHMYEIFAVSCPEGLMTSMKGLLELSKVLLRWVLLPVWKPHWRARPLRVVSTAPPGVGPNVALATDFLSET